MNQVADSVEDIQTFHGGCPHDCPDTCSMVYKVKEGQLISVKGNTQHPMTRGGLCVKLHDFEKHHYNPERVLYPLKRSGPKGTREYTRISWDEALNTIKTRWTDIIEKHGAQAIMPYSYLGNQGIVQGLNVGDPFFNKLGATVTERTFCGSASSTAWLMTYGPTGGLDPESFKHSTYIVIWGCNSVSTNLHHWHIVHEAQKKGAKVVVIDTYKSKTAKEADWHLMPKPGTDGALAMALINTLIEQDLIDHDYVDNYTLGFDDLKLSAKDCTPEWAEAITGIAASDIRQLAKEFATAEVAALRPGVAVERHYGGGQTLRAIFCIPALTGAWKKVGGGVMQMPLWEFPLKFDLICRPDFIKEGTQVVSAIQFGAALLGETALKTPIKSVMFYNANPVSQAPESNKIVEGLSKDDMFVVTAEHFITDTASYSDIILPATMAAEMDDMILSWGHFYLTYNQKAIEPPGETASNAEIFRRLAKLFGFDEPQFQRSDVQMVEDTINWDAPAMQGITMEDFKRDGYAHLNVGTPDTRLPHAKGNFPTPSGKAELKTSAAAGGNFVAGPFRQCYDGFQGGEHVDAVPSYVLCKERPETNPALAATYPLNIVTPKSHGFLNSCYANEALKIKGQGEQFVLINPKDASERSIENGQYIRVFNERGEFHGDARVTDDTLPGVVVATLGYWRSKNRGGGAVNVISSDRFINLGHGPTLSDNLVQVELG